MPFQPWVGKKNTGFNHAVIAKKRFVGYSIRAAANHAQEEMTMTIGKKIAQYRRKLNITQEALATQLGVSNQAVSKWEADTCCPDIQLLPKLADIFEVTLDELFDRETKQPAADLPWEDDGTLRAVLFVGRKLIGGHPAAERIQFHYEGPALNVESAFSVTCDEVQGNVTAGLDVTCDEVCGDVKANGNITCDEVHGNVTAGRDVTCDEINGNVWAGRDIHCDHLDGSFAAGNQVLINE